MTKMTNVHWATVSTGLLFVAIWSFVALVAHSVGALGSVATLVGLGVALLWLPATWRFCLREARGTHD